MKVRYLYLLLAYSIFIQANLVTAQNSDLLRLKKVWQTNVGIGVDEVANQVTTNAVGDVFFAGSGSCAFINQFGGNAEICNELLLAEYLLPDGFNGNGAMPDAQILCRLSSQGAKISSPLWLYSCDDRFHGLGEDLLVTSDDEKICLIGTCFGAFEFECPNLSSLGSRAFLRVFNSSLDDEATFTFPPTGGDQPCSPPNAEGRDSTIVPVVPGIDLIYLVGPNLQTGNSFIARYLYFGGAVTFLDSIEFSSEVGGNTANTIFSDEDFNIYVAGCSSELFDPSFSDPSINGSDVFIIKFDSALNEQWRKQIDINVTNQILNVNSVVVNEAGVVTVGGSRELSNSNTAKPYLFKFDQNQTGMPVFSYIEGESNLSIEIFANNTDGHIEDLAINTSGNVLALGRVLKDPNGSAENCGVVVEFASRSDGSFEVPWVHQIENTQGFGIHIDQSNKDIFVCGRTGDNRAFTAKLVLLGDVNCDGLVNTFDVAPFVAKLQNGIYCPKADVNCDGIVSSLDSFVLTQLIFENN